MSKTKKWNSFLKGLLALSLVSFSAQAEEDSRYFFCANPKQGCRCSASNPQKEDFRVSATEDFGEKKSFVFTCSNNLTSKLSFLTSFLNDSTAMLSMKVECGIPISGLDFSAPTPSQKWIFNGVQAFPENCGYKLYVKMAKIQKAAESIIEKGEHGKCQPNMCTGANYLAFIYAMKRLHEEKKISDEQWAVFSDISNSENEVFLYLNTITNPKALVEHYGLGEGRILQKNELNDSAKEGWPRAGDFVQIWRDDFSGHSVVFGGYLYDPSIPDKVVGVCYWSANKGTKGYGNQCEPTAEITSLIAGRITK